MSKSSEYSMLMMLAILVAETGSGVTWMWMGAAVLFGLSAAGNLFLEVVGDE